MGGNCRLVQRCSTPNRGQPSSSPRQPSGRGGTAQAPRGRNSQTQSGTRQTGCGTRSDQQGIGIFCLFHLPRPAGATSPHGRVLRAAAKTGIVFARREESAVHTNDSRLSKKNGQPDRRLAGVFQDRAGRDQKDGGGPGAARQGGGRGK